MSSRLVPAATRSVTFVHVFHGPLPAFCTLYVTCDDSSEDDEAHGVYKVKLGADDVGDLGIALREISIASVDPEGLAQYRAHVTLRPGMVLRSINGVPVARLAYEAVCELTGLGDNNGSTDVRGLTMCFHRPD